MKKICIMFILVFSILLSYTKTYAFGSAPLEKINYLDLANLEYKWWNEGYAGTINSIELKPDTTYTLIMSRNFLGSRFENSERIEFEAEEPDGSNWFNVYLTIDHEKDLAYHTFTTRGSLFDIILLPVNGMNNYEAMIYEGTYAGFPGFVPYTEDGEQLEYYGFLALNYDRLPEMEAVLNYVNAKKTSGQVLTKSIIYDDYSTGEKRPGNYQMVFETEYNQIRKRFLLDIKIYDIVAPTLSVAGTLSIPVDQKWSVDQIKEKITILDNVDDLNGSHLNVIHDTYSAATSVGNYQMTFEVSDSSGNKNTIEVLILLVDETGPTIKGPTDIYLYTTDESISIDQIYSKLSIRDDVDKTDVTWEVIENEYNLSKSPGQYSITFKASDQSRNSTSFTVRIHVIDNQGPIFEHNELILDKTTKDQMTESEIILWLKEQLNLMGHHASDINILYNEYETREKKEGSYYVYLSYKLGEEDVTSRIRIDVEKEKSSIINIVLPISGVLIIGLGVFIWFKYKKN